MGLSPICDMFVVLQKCVCAKNEVSTKRKTQLSVNIKPGRGLELQILQQYVYKKKIKKNWFSTVSQTQ